MGFEVLYHTLATHILYNLLGSIECPLVFIVLQKIFKNMPQHFRVDADFAIFGIIFINSEIVYGEEVH